jgi:hypothetical protein
MNELAARIADGWAQPPSEIERAALAVIHKQVPITSHVSLAGHGPAEFGENCPDCSAMLSYIRKLLAVVEPLISARERARLAGEGSLHPAGSEHRVQLLLRWYFPDGHTLDWGGDDMASVLALLGEPPELVRDPPTGALGWSVGGSTRRGDQ